MKRRRKHAQRASAASKGTSAQAPVTSAGSPRHRLLLFSQMRSMLDVVEDLVLRRVFPSCSWLRIDGSIPGSRRGQVAQAFQSDPSVDLMLLTTSVGSLGLDLSAADTVIMLDHDWNPTVDLQAMDRAHRIGQ